MNTLYVTADMLEQYRRCVCTNYVTEQELTRAIISGHSEQTWQKKAESAWRQALATRHPWEASAATIQTATDGGEVSEVADHLFTASDLIEAIRYNGPGSYSIPGEFWFMAHNISVCVRHTAEHMQGLFVQQNKACFGDFDPQHYEDSLAWRIACLTHNASVFRLNLWLMRSLEGEICQTHGLWSKRYWPYPLMFQEVSSWVWQFATWAMLGNLAKYLEKVPQ